jgi:hypothetical protein
VIKSAVQLEGVYYLARGVFVEVRGEFHLRYFAVGVVVSVGDEAFVRELLAFPQPIQTVFL